jgi:hypothetical protein
MRCVMSGVIWRHGVGDEASLGRVGECAGHRLGTSAGGGREVVVVPVPRHHPPVLACVCWRAREVMEALLDVLVLERHRHSRSQYVHK